MHPLSVGDRDRGHHSVHELARRAGLAGRTGRGRRYDLVDLLDEVVAAPVPATSVLDGRPVSTRWARADTRVVVARAVTDLVDGYAASLATLLGAARDVPQAEAADVVTDLLEHLAPTVVVVDALQASVGTDGGRVLDVVDSASILVATDAVTPSVSPRRSPPGCSRSRRRRARAHRRCPRSPGARRRRPRWVPGARGDR